MGRPSSTAEPLLGAGVTRSRAWSGGRARSRPLFERIYARLSPRMDAGGLIELRRALLLDVSGTVIEIGAGDGRNFAHYPGAVSRVVAVEPGPYLGAIARRNAARAAVQIDVVRGVVERLPASDATFDCAVVSLVLCSVADQHKALAEIRRVLRPGGTLHFLEHVAADSRRLRTVQRALDATVWPRVAGGCHMGRDTVGAISSAGFEVERVERSRWPDSKLPAPTAPHVLGVARRADGDAHGRG